MVPPACAGKPPAPDEHNRVASFAAPSGGTPSCWESNCVSRKLDASCEEYKAVEAYFLRTVRKEDVVVTSCTRLQNPQVYARYSAEGGETIMFHGCRSEENERSIIQNGFLVSRCSSGGQNYGTWLAYGAAYSDAGYSFFDERSEKHLFVCVVSYRHTVRDDCTMRVVGQDCAYPLWRLTYKVPLPPPRAPTIMPAPAQLRIARRGRPDTVCIVRDGQWVEVTWKEWQQTKLQSPQSSSFHGRIDKALAV